MPYGPGTYGPNFMQNMGLLSQQPNQGFMQNTQLTGKDFMQNMGLLSQQPQPQTPPFDMQKMQQMQGLLRMGRQFAPNNSFLQSLTGAPIGVLSMLSQQNR